MVSERQQIADEIAYAIRRQLVCCDIFSKLGGLPLLLMTDEDIEHEICYWGEAAARIAEEEGKK